MLEAGAASVEQIDAAVEAAGFPLGPFAFMDLVGIDVNLGAARAIFEATGEERFRPSATQEQLVEAGRLGRKSGIGFYRYSEDGTREPAYRSDVERPRALEGDVIVERIELAIDNEAFHVVAEGVADPADVDRAMRLGANHPAGPFERASSRGLDVTRRRLEALAGTEGPRFEPAPGIGP